MTGGVSASTVIAGAGLALTAASMASKAGASSAGGASSAAAANYQAQVAANNKIVADQEAEKAIQSGLVTADITSKKGAARTANIKASQAANGIDVNTGSAVDVRSGSRMASKVDAETALNNAEWTGWGYRARGVGYGAEAGLDRMEAGSDLAGGAAGATGAYFGGAGSILQNASQLPFGKMFGNGKPLDTSIGGAAGGAGTFGGFDGTE